MGEPEPAAKKKKGARRSMATKSIKTAPGKTQSGKLTYDNTEKYIKLRVPGGDKDEVNIHYHEAGEEHPDTIVFLHGGGLGASGWFNFYLNIEPFAEHFRTILIDMPNFGRSDALLIKDIDEAGYDSNLLSEFLKAKGIDKATLMGNSKGGADAIRFSVDHTDQLDLNILMGASTGPSISDVMPPQGTGLLGDIMREPTRELVEKVLHLFVFDDSFVTDEWLEMRWQSTMDAEKREHRKTRLEIAKVNPQDRDAQNQTHLLYKVANPTLVIFGAHDRFAALDSSVSLMRHYPNSELHVYRNCGHWVQFEMADEFNEMVINWMEGKIAERVG